MGKDSTSSNARTERVARPLSSLKDPASFGPPPKRVDRGAAALSDKRASAGTPTSGSYTQLGKTTSEGSQSAPTPPPLPFRQNRTGLSTDHLPPPPTRSQSAKPSVPPRLPARSGASPAVPESSPSPPPPYTKSQEPSQLNQAAISSLSQAGVSVPALGIGRTTSDAAPGNHVAASTNQLAAANSQVNQLQSRFAAMSTGTIPGTQSPSSVESRGVNGCATHPVPVPTTQSLPPTRSLSDAHSSAQRFRERHADQIEAGKKKLSALNQKYRITERINEFIEDQTSPAEPAQGQAVPPGPPPPPPPHPNFSRTASSSSNIDIEALNRRKPPPPPPPAKKAALKAAPVQAAPTATPTPPPLPLATKPR